MVPSGGYICGAGCSCGSALSLFGAEVERGVISPAALPSWVGASSISTSSSAVVLISWTTSASASALNFAAAAAFFFSFAAANAARFSCAADRLLVPLGVADGAGEFLDEVEGAAAGLGGAALVKAAAAAGFVSARITRAW